ncbi:hypothetical protein V8E54_005765 [Elaphomyces granulatus]
MNITWVLGFPSGNEQGKFLTLDMGGTNLRVCEVVLTDVRGEFQVTQSKYRMPDELKSGTPDQLWGFIAGCIGDFVEQHHLSPEQPSGKLPLAFTFSYPVTQPSIRQGILQRWTKDFDIDGIEGHDVVPQLEAALKERNIPVKVVALVNDTTGALIASAYSNSEVKIGSILSTGCNAAYMEECSSVAKMKGDGVPGCTPVAINTEYGAFDNEHKVLPLTSFDCAIDESSPRPGQQTYEKMVAGLYMGELLRLVLLDLHDRDKLFQDQDVLRLRQDHVVDCAFLAKIEEGTVEDISKAFNETLGIKLSAQELLVARYLAELIVTRAARLYACGIAAICKKKNIRSCRVGVDGSDCEALVTLHSAEDGSGVGAALIAAIGLERLKEKQDESSGLRLRRTEP